MSFVLSIHHSDDKLRTAPLDATVHINLSKAEVLSVVTVIRLSSLTQTSLTFPCFLGPTFAGKSTSKIPCAKFSAGASFIKPGLLSPSTITITDYNTSKEALTGQIK